jgi:putative ABC transport system permease protein
VIRHVFALIWNRRRTNLLMMIEVFVSFLVLFVVATLGAYYWRNYRQPLGFSVDDVWRVTLKVENRSTAPPDPEHTRRLLAAIEALPQVVAIAAIDTSPYGGGRFISDLKNRRYYWTKASDSLPAVLGVEVVRGRWFTREDDGVPYVPVVVSESFARAHFGSADPIGQRFDHGNVAMQRRVVGMVRHFQQDGELGSLGAPQDVVFGRIRLDAPDARPPPFLLLRLRPNTTAEVEEKLLNTMHAVARDWSFDLTDFQRLRRQAWKETLTALVAVGVVAGFLMIMVALGLTGVVWQNVTQRTREVGLRRAAGATAAHIRRQILGELLAMASLALGAGALVVAQLPLLDLIAWVPGEVYLAGFAISVAAIYFLVVVCGSYPARLATRIQPFEALRHE